MPPKIELNFKIRLFKAAFISILLYDCETWFHGNINRETRHICQNMLPYHARYHSDRCSASANLSSQANVSAWLQTIPPIDLSFINQGSIHLMDQDHQGRHISIKFRRLFYNLAQKYLEAGDKMAVNKSELSQLFVVSLGRKSLNTDLLSSYDDDNDQIFLLLDTIFSLSQACFEKNISYHILKIY